MRITIIDTRRAFSMAEMLIIMLVISVAIAASLPLMTKFKNDAMESNIKTCLVTQKAASLSFTGTNSSINLASATNECKRSIQDCVNNGNIYCQEIASYTNTNAINAAHKVLRAACDLGSTEACRYFVNKCAKENICDDPSSEFDLHYYMYLHDYEGLDIKKEILKLTVDIYKKGVTNIVNFINNRCGGQETACTVMCLGGSDISTCSTGCYNGVADSCNHLTTLCNSGNTESCNYLIDNCGYYTVNTACEALQSSCGQYASSCNTLATSCMYNNSQCSYLESECGMNGSNNQKACNALLTACTGGNQAACNSACNLGIKQCKWAKRFGGTYSDTGYSIAVDSTGVYVTGEEYSDANGGVYYPDIFVLKLNPSTGTVIWKKRLGGTVEDYGHGIVVDSTGVYIAGREKSDPGGTYFKILALKLDPSNGNVIWKKRFGQVSFHDTGYALAIDSSGVYITGAEYSNAAGMSDIFAIKLNLTNGIVIWKKRLGGYDLDQGNAITVDSTGVYITGEEYSDANGGTSYTDAFAIKLNPSTGTAIWKKKFGGTRNDKSRGIAVDSTGTYVIGDEYSDAVGGTSYLDAFVLKLNPSTGTVIWKKRFGGANDDSGHAITVDSNGVYITGYQSTDTAGAYDIFVLKLNPSNGAVIWKRKLGGSGSDVGKGIIVNGSYIYLTGYQYSDYAGSSNSDVFVIKMAGTQTNNLNTYFDGFDLNTLFDGADLNTYFAGTDLNTYLDGTDLNTLFNGASLNTLFDGTDLDPAKFFL